MKKIFFLFFIVIFSGCISLGVRGDYNSLENQFDSLVSKPIKERDRKSLERKFIKLKKQINKDQEISRDQKIKMNKNIDYYIMILDDLKD